MENNNLSLDEKIDYVYTYIKKVERREIINLYLKWIFRVTMFLYIIYFIYFWLPKLIDSFKDIIIPKVWVDNFLKESEDMQWLKDKLKDILNSKNKQWIY